jgi:cholesterol 7-dehydrogenase
LSHDRPSDELRERSYPPPYPDGWYRLAAANDLRPGALRYLECLGQQLVLFRSDDDEVVHAMAAFCPHLGANLAGGCVKDGRVECPFHCWQIAGNGEIVSIPYAKRLPTSFRQRTWPVREQHGQIFFYHRGGTGADTSAPPPYDPPRIADIDEGRLVPRGTHDGGIVHMHLLEFAENSVDFQHFSPLHGRMFVPWTRMTIPGVKIVHDAKWQVATDPAMQHIAYFRNESVLEVFGHRIARTRASAVITFYGPAGIVAFRFTLPDLGDILMFQMHLPVAPMMQKVDFAWFAAPKIPRALVSYVVGSWISQWRNDIAIWENKIHRPKPLLVAEDGPIHRLRKWFSQFYPDGAAPSTTAQVGR